MYHGLRDKECPRCGGRGWIKSKPYVPYSKCERKGCYGLLDGNEKIVVGYHPHGNFVFVPYMTTSASTKRYMGCKIARSAIARISDKTIRTRATICQGRSMFLLPVRRVDRCSEYQMHRFINHCFLSLRCRRCRCFPMT